MGIHSFNMSFPPLFPINPSRARPCIPSENVPDQPIQSVAAPLSVEGSGLSLKYNPSTLMVADDDLDVKIGNASILSTGGAGLHVQTNNTTVVFSGGAMGVRYDNKTVEETPGGLSAKLDNETLFVSGNAVAVRYNPASMAVVAGGLSTVSTGVVTSSQNYVPQDIFATNCVQGAWPDLILITTRVNKLFTYTGFCTVDYTGHDVPGPYSNRIMSIQFPLQPPFASYNTSTGVGGFGAVASWRPFQTTSQERYSVAWSVVTDDGMDDHLIEWFFPPPTDGFPDGPATLMFSFCTSSL